MKRLLLTVAAVLAALGPGTPAWAHARLVTADPAADTTLTAAPTAVTLGFSERLDADFTTIVVSDAARQRVPASPVTVDGARGTLTLTGALSNGVYTVAFRVVSVDGHTVHGSYPFTLADPARPAAAPAPAATVPAAARDSTGPALAVGGGGVVLAAVAVWLYLATRRPAGT
ncbi:hypothetical protein Q0Z83_037590 [Actinoplanes sichuanensis]|uniref:Copper resistance protein CopC n=1 Tax=Actinoplanes sichuanensis TaxID=512349 RepID=A0ABW4A3K3_9ACTN|nr:copper resistance CopC family protein [Actinoplanes sichuanensis]BEL05568.1 hypothetical protein Q0Z83_037590 [Actinoplanes sichuanensis]